MKRSRLAVATIAAIGLLVTAPPAFGQQVVARDACATAGICEDAVNTYGMNVNDWNGDGRPDIFMVRHFQSFPRLYTNIGGGVFASQDTAARFPGSRRRDWHDCPWADVNGDDREDVYCTVGGKGGGTAPNANELWIQQPGGTFAERAGAYGVRDRFGRGRQSTFINVNGDRFPDLFVGNTFPRRDGRRSPNRLFVNVDGERFRQARSYGLTKELDSNSVQAVDYDRDRDEDLLLCGKNRLHVFERQGPRFRDVRRKLGLPRTCKVGEFVRANRDARRDLVVMTTRGLEIWVRKAGRRGRPFKRAERVAISGKVADVATGDVDGDNRADVYVARRGALNADRPDLMLLNRGDATLRRKNIPQYSAGRGDAVAAIDHDGNGLDDFVVMNGHRDTPGPIRLVAFYPRP